MAFRPKPEQLTQIWYNALFTGRVSLDCQVCIALIFGYSCSLHLSSALVHALVPGVPSTKASGWTPWAQEAATLCFFPTSPSSTESVNSLMQHKLQFILLAQSFACTQRRTNILSAALVKEYAYVYSFSTQPPMCWGFSESLLKNYNQGNTEVFRFCLFSIENSNTVRHNGNRRLQLSESYLLGCFLV